MLFTQNCIIAWNNIHNIPKTVGVKFIKVREATLDTSMRYDKRVPICKRLHVFHRLLTRICFLDLDSNFYSFFYFQCRALLCISPVRQSIHQNCSWCNIMSARAALKWGNKPLVVLATLSHLRALRQVCLTKSAYLFPHFIALGIARRYCTDYCLELKLLQSVDPVRNPLNHFY